MKHILIVEDDPPVAELLRSTLERLGHQLEWASNGRTAQRLILETPMSLHI